MQLIIAHVTVPNILTVFRLLISPVIWCLLYIYTPFSSILATFLFLVASLTDFLDGYIARVYSMHSSFGKIFDPIADKILVVSIMMMLVHSSVIASIHVFAVVIIICREIFISGLREFLLSVGKTRIDVSILGKIKTTMQIITISVLMLSIHCNLFSVLGEVLLWVSAFFAVLSGVHYLTNSLSEL
ncbi:MAG: CDP-diacylglycerol--glycerol-3-phosphate 3-phosphatidyltransferase [Candidatus Xenolissoclinum pacificiensis L6]|uniref:CDP-diacylglycerol--glycerol-3-phosphate 3-phosphatidyltransferase n=1 Tax=Candidatus Xenolissoclinum pacificiensis L6 TaxID=1401685 RepID=W2V369_9RICK|nr:MAG: CDP-diacylglycerol--glycerol-3-phosphate 3-phosphatidyltransferase [Candidatus Xenolissoclinum pacificiensis L6]